MTATHASVDARLLEAARTEGDARRSGHHPDVERYRDLRLFATDLAGRLTTAERERDDLLGAFNASCRETDKFEARMEAAEKALQAVGDAALQGYDTSERLRADVLAIVRDARAALACPPQQRGDDADA